jgi:hypothetical protein
MRLLSELTFGAYLVYSPRGQSPISQRSRKIRDAIKRGDERTLKGVVDHLATNLAASGLDAVLGPDVTLVPSPGSAPLLEHGLWVPNQIAHLLVRAGLGREVVPCLARSTSVPKSAFQPADQRPTAQRHFETIEASTQLLLSMNPVTLIDDVITKGSTFLGAASRLAASKGCAPRAFALLRTMSSGDVEKLVDPCVGKIRDGYYGTYRRP